jgi:hypothetical protein
LTGFASEDSLWLKDALDKSEPDTVLVGYCTDDPLFHRQELVRMDEVEPTFTVMACIYKLIKANPARFKEPTTGLDHECAWGIHHEDWQRALEVIYFTKKRRADFGNCPVKGKYKYDHFRRCDEYIHAYATPYVITYAVGLQARLVNEWLAFEYLRGLSTE